MNRRFFFLLSSSGFLFFIANPLRTLEQYSESQQRRDPFYDLTKVISLRNNLIKDPELKKLGYSPKTIDDLFNDPAFKIRSVVVKSFKDNPENLVGVGKQSYVWYAKNIKINQKMLDSRLNRLKYEEYLIDAQKKYNVDGRIISALLGIESDYGNNLGKYKAFNALVSAYILLPNKKNSAYQQLKHYLIFCKSKKIPIYSLKSSYAGAIGPMQFMPASLNDFFIGNNPLSMKEAIYSIANFIKNKWYMYYVDEDNKENNIKVKASWNMEEPLKQTLENVITYKSNRSIWNLIGSKKKLTPEEIKVIKEDVASKTNNRLAIEKYNASDAFVRAVLEIALNSDLQYQKIKKIKHILKQPNQHNPNNHNNSSS